MAAYLVYAGAALYLGVLTSITCSRCRNVGVGQAVLGA